MNKYKEMFILSKLFSLFSPQYESYVHLSLLFLWKTINFIVGDPQNYSVDSRLSVFLRILLLFLQQDSSAHITDIYTDKKKLSRSVAPATAGACARASVVDALSDVSVTLLKCSFCVHKRDESGVSGYICTEY